MRRSSEPASEERTSATSSMERQLELHRPRLRALATRLLGSTADADDALQETWIRASRIEVPRSTTPVDGSPP